MNTYDDPDNSTQHSKHSDRQTQQMDGRTLGLMYSVVVSLYTNDEFDDPSSISLNIRHRISFIYDDDVDCVLCFLSLILCHY